MGFLARVLFVVVVISAIGAWLHSYYPGLGLSASVALVPTNQGVATTTKEVSTDSSFSNSDTYIDVEGTALMDTTGGLPPVPFIQYVATNHALVTKQLIFANSRGCNPNAGDIPCVPSYPTDNAYPTLMTGERIAVKGYVRADRLLVYEITPL